MKIAIITAGVLPFPPIKGGAVESLIEFYVEDNEKHLRLNDFTIISIFDKCINQSASNKYDKTSFVYIKVNSWVKKIEGQINLIVSKFLKKTINGSYLRKVVREIMKTSYDLIIVENRPEFILYLSQKVDTDIILHLHNDSLNENSPDGLKIVSACKEIWCVSNFIRRRVESIQKNTKIKLLYNGVNISCFVKQNSKLTIKKDLGFKDSDFIIVFSGRISKMKGVKELIESFILLKNKGFVNTKLLILGGSFYGANVRKDKYLKEIERLVEPFKCDIVFTGFIGYDKIPQYLAIADLAVVPSVWDEPFGLTVVESLSMGIPLIVSDSGGIPEIVTSKCAIVVKRGVNFVMDLADSIAFLRNDSNTRSQMSVVARERSFLFSKENYCKSFYNLLCEK